jgi:hypothetical protein
MQQTDLFIVAVIFWGGIGLFLLYLLLRLGDIEKQLKIVENQVEGDQ